MGGCHQEPGNLGQFLVCHDPIQVRRSVPNNPMLFVRLNGGKLDGMNSAAAIAFPNIAFIKYWGNRDNALRIPSNGSLSMNLAGLETHTTVRFDPDLPADELSINGETVTGPGLDRVSTFLDRVRSGAGIQPRAAVTSTNNFPIGTGIASSASAFAALALAASKAADLDLDEAELSRLARTGSGSACRSVPSGFVEWSAGSSHQDSFGFSIAPPTHWDLVDCIAVVSSEHKPTGSTQGHTLADTSPLQNSRVAGAPERVARCRTAILKKDFDAFAEVVELDSNLMHAVMMTSTSPHSCIGNRQPSRSCTPSPTGAPTEYQLATLSMRVRMSTSSALRTMPLRSRLDSL